MTFKTSLGTTARFTTIGITLLFISILVRQFSFIYDAGQPAFFMTSIVLVIIYFGAYFFRPLNYEITKDQIIIHRPVKNVVLNIKDIKSVGLIHNTQMHWAIRTFGVGGLFGYYGIFYNWKMGRMTWYTTRRNKRVLLTTVNNQKIILTPDEPENFISQFNSATLSMTV